MKTYIALFRSINVGGKNILPMKDLTKLLENLGCTQVKTYIQSGNVVFSTAETDRNKLINKISEGISDQFSFSPKILLLQESDLKKAIDHNPFPTDDGKVLHFFFLETEAESPDLEGLAALKTDTEEFNLFQDVFYLYAPDGIGRSKLAAKVEQKLGVAVTARNWNTVDKLNEMVKQIGV